MSATSAVIYLQSIWSGLTLEGPFVILLAVFALLTAWGIRDSSYVALIMYVLHLTTMSVLIVGGIVIIVGNGGSLLRDNWLHEYPSIMDGHTVRFPGNAVNAVVFGK